MENTEKILENLNLNNNLIENNKQLQSNENDDKDYYKRTLTDKSIKVELIANKVNIDYHSFCEIFKFRNDEKIRYIKYKRIKNANCHRYLISRLYSDDTFWTRSKAYYKNDREIYIRCKIIRILDLSYGLYAILTNNRELLIFDMIDRTPLQRIKTTRKPKCICKLSSSKEFVVGTHDGAIMLFNISLKVPLVKENLISGVESPVNDIKLLKKDVLVVACNDNSLAAYDEFLVRLYRVENCHSHWIHSIFILRSNGLFTKNNNSCFISTSHDNTIKVWSEEILLKQTLTRHTNGVFDCIELKNGKLVSCGADKQILIWKIENMKYEYDFKLDDEHKNDILKLKELSNGYLASISGDSKLYVWDLSKKYSVYQIKHKNELIHDVLEINNYYLVGSSNLLVYDKKWNLMEISH